MCCPIITLIITAAVEIIHATIVHASHITKALENNTIIRNS